MFVNILLGKRLEILAHIKEHWNIRFLWVSDNISMYFYQPPQWDKELVAFLRDVVEGMLPPTLQTKQ